jgi:RNA polymerase sigma-70 factor (ECF subfamily)
MEKLDQLIIDAQRGNRESLDRLFDCYRPLLRLMAQQSISLACRRREDASDVVQTTVLEAYRSLSEFRGRTALEFSSWMKQILRRNVLNLTRDNQAAKRDVRREQLVDNDSSVLTWRYPAAHQSSPSEHVMKAEAALAVAQALEALPEGQQAAVRMRHIEGRSLNEIAKALDRSPTAAAGLLRRGLATLRGRLDGEVAWI